jgi:hypothetical protein
MQGRVRPQGEIGEVGIGPASVVRCPCSGTQTTRPTHPRLGQATGKDAARLQWNTDHQADPPYPLLRVTQVCGAAINSNGHS